MSQSIQSQQRLGNPLNSQKYNNAATNFPQSRAQQHNHHSFSQHQDSHNESAQSLESFQQQQQPPRQQNYGIQPGSSQYFNQQQQNTTDKQKVLIFYKSLLQQHQDSQKLSLITLQIVKLLNLTLNIKGNSETSSDLVKEFFNLTNILIYPQRLKVSHQNEQEAYESQQERVRDVILYLKVIKQVLKLQNDDELFSLSDVIDEQNINSQPLIYHLMTIYEKILGQNTQKIHKLSQYEILELQRDLEPLVQKQNQFQEQIIIQSQGIIEKQKQIQQQNIQQQQSQSEESNYYERLKQLEKKLNAYKNEYVKVKQLNKHQEKLIAQYEDAIKQLSEKKESKNKVQNLQNRIYDQFLQSLKANHQSEINQLQNRQVSQISLEQNQQQNRSRSQSPFFNDQSAQIQLQQLPSISVQQQRSTKSEEVSIQTLQLPTQSRLIQCDPDSTAQELENLTIIYEQLVKEKDQLVKDKNDLLMEKHNFNLKLSEIQQRFEKAQEGLDQKQQKYQQIKSQIKRIQDEGENKELGVERLKEEISQALKQKLDADARTKKFESQFRNALKEIDELREQVEELKKQTKEKEEDSASQGSSYYIFNQSQHQQEVKVSELERERDFLQTKVQMLEKSNKELLNYKRSLEEALTEISKEEDVEKRVKMLDINLIRRKSLLRLESAARENRFASPDRSPIQSRDISPNYLGQRQQAFNQFEPGSKNSLLAPPQTYQENLLSSGYSSNLDTQTNNDLNQILEQIQQMESRSTTPVNRDIMVLDEQQPQIQQRQPSSRMSFEQDFARTEQPQNESNIERLELLNQFKEQKTINEIPQSQQEEEEKVQHQGDDQEEDEVEDNAMFKLIKQNTAKKILDDALTKQSSFISPSVQKDIQKQTINEEANEDEYDDEEDSSSNASFD